MGSLGRERYDQRHREDIEMGPDGAYYEGEYKHDRRAERGQFDWNEESRYDEGFAENNIHDKGVYE